MTRFFFALALAGFAGAVFAGCFEPADNPSRTQQADGATICWWTEPERVVIGTVFQVNVRVWTEQGPWNGTLRVDATMPAHGHGMNYLPVVSQVDEGRFVAEGLLFHMPGEWELLFDLDGGDRQIRIGSKLHVD